MQSTTRTIVKTITVRVCACSTIEAQGVKADDLPKRYREFVDAEGTLHTGCEAETQRTYAPGHDARTAGILAALHRKRIKVLDADGQEVDALTFAEDNLSEALVAKVAYEPKERPKAEPVEITVNGETVKARIGRDGIARVVDSDATHKPGTFLLA